jgi:hypothetical protein
MHPHAATCTHLPVELAIINHGVHAEGLDAVHATHLELCITNLNNINRVVVTLGGGRGEGGSKDIARGGEGIRRQADWSWCVEGRGWGSKQGDGHELGACVSAG